MRSHELTLMAVHAHPDDESSSTGGVLARSSAEGIRTVLVTCTNGELGDGPGHVKPDSDGHDCRQVAGIRRRELQVACAALGVHHLEMLGYPDSGMPDWRHRHLDESFCNVPVEVVGERLAELMARYRPDVVITYGGSGRYNHPDHVHAHHATVAAVESTRIPAKLYFIARRRQDRERVIEALRARGIDVAVPTPPLPDPDQVREWEARQAALEAQITTWIDTSAYAAQKHAALAAHASQLDESWWMAVPPDMCATVFPEETFIRARDTTGAPLPETDLFAGLRAGSVVEASTRIGAPGSSAVDRREA